MCRRPFAAATSELRNRSSGSEFVLVGCRSPYSVRKYSCTAVQFRLSSLLRRDPMKVRPLLTALLLAASSHSLYAQPRSSDAPSTWDAFVTSLLDAYFVQRPDVAINAGRHEFDGKLPDWSAKGLADFGAMLTDWRARAVKF